MSTTSELLQSWTSLPVGARAALEEQWDGLAAGGLPCGASIVDEAGTVVASGRNCSYEPAGVIETRARYALQHNRLAHAELNALAQLATEMDHAKLTLWTTQHPCLMCAAAIIFTGIGQVVFIADDPSDDSSSEAILASRGSIVYKSLGDPFWWTISNLLFLYNSAVLAGENARNLKLNRDRYPELVRLTLDLAKAGTIGKAARSNIELPIALTPHYETILRVSQYAAR